VTSRRQRIDGYAQRGQIADDARRRMRECAPARMPAALAARIEAFLAAADDLARLAEDEVLVLEAARDWPEADGAR
jgi:hypothetical protein